MSKVRAIFGLLVMGLVFAGLSMLPGRISNAQTVSDKEAVRCQLNSYNTGWSQQIIQCTGTSVGYFTVVPDGKWLMLTDVMILPYYPTSTTMTGLRVQEVSGTALFTLVDFRVPAGASPWSASTRNGFLLLAPGTSAQLTTWSDTNSSGIIIMSGIMSSDPSAVVR
jgi:hypothetical protein